MLVFISLLVNTKAFVVANVKEFPSHGFLNCLTVRTQETGFLCIALLLNPFSILIVLLLILSDFLGRLSYHLQTKTVFPLSFLVSLSLPSCPDFIHWNIHHAVK